MLSIFNNLNPAESETDGIVEPLQGAGNLDIGAVINRIIALEAAVEEIRAAMQEKPENNDVNAPQSDDNDGGDNTPDSGDNAPDEGDKTNDRYIDEE